MARRARPVLADLGLDVPLRRLVAELSLAQRQLIEIAKALLTEPRVLILDEPTSALGAQSTELLFDVLRVLRDREVGVVFVSHILEDVMALCDEVTVLRDGEVAMAARPRAELTVPVIVEAMLGERDARAETPDESLAESVAEALEVESSGRLELRSASVDGPHRGRVFERRPRRGGGPCRGRGRRAPHGARAGGGADPAGQRVGRAACQGARCRAGCATPYARAWRW